MTTLSTETRYYVRTDKGRFLQEIGIWGEFDQTKSWSAVNRTLAEDLLVKIGKNRGTSGTAEVVPVTITCTERGAN